MGKTPIITTVNTGCPVCGNDNGHEIAAGLRDIENGVPGKYTISECSECHTKYLSPRPDNKSLPACYDPGYHVRSKRTRKRLFRLLLDARHPLQYRSLKQHLKRPPRSILEIGCGDGRFLFFVEKKVKTGCRLVGIDLNTSHIERPAFSKVEFIDGSVDTLSLRERFDLVMMYDVLEHLPDPAESLKKVRALMEPDGILIVKTPNWDSVWRKAFPRHWSGLQIPRHMFFPDPRSLATLFKAAGLEVRELHNVFDPGDLSVSVCNYLADRLHLRTPPRQVWFYLPAALLAAPLVFLQLVFLRESGEIECLCTLRNKE